MYCYPNFSLSVYGFVFLRPPISDFSFLSSPAFSLLFELYLNNDIQFIFCDHRRVNTKHFVNFSLPAAIELASYGLLIDTNISYN